MEYKKNITDIAEEKMCSVMTELSFLSVVMDADEKLDLDEAGRQGLKNTLSRLSEELADAMGGITIEKIDLKIAA